MTRFPSRVALMTTVVVATIGLASAFGQRPGADPERAFTFGDTDLDGRLTLQELQELAQNAPRAKGQNGPPPAFLEAAFRRSDTNGDGALSLEEYRAMVLRQQGGMFAKKAFAKTKGFGPFGPGMAKTPPKAVATASKVLTSEETKYFETKIRPVLVSQCYKCHASTSDKVKGSLLVDTRDGLLKGGDNGPAVVPGKPEESLLLKAIRHDDEELQMPPKSKLPDEVVADFENWIKLGAPDPRVSDKGASTARATDAAKVREHWAFREVQKTPAPKVADGAWPRSDVDRFILAGLEAKGLKPVGDATREALLRRVTFDLTGLPPTPDDLRAYLQDASPEALAKVVDRLLASKAFGERWGRHWLDVARYAESSGKVNFAYPTAWRYRDYVIHAFNADTPFNTFVREQIAGDLLPAANAGEKARLQVATGFLAVGSKNHNTQNRRQFQLDLADEQIDATGQAILGLTVACARCHDHKFDPITQRDYYALSGIFQSTETCYGTLRGMIQNNNPSTLIEVPRASGLPAGVPRMTPERRSTVNGMIDDLVKQLQALPARDRLTTPKGFVSRARLATLRSRIDSFEADGTPKILVMGVRDHAEPLDSPFFVRGELDQPAEIVPRGLIASLHGSTPPTVTRGSGRLELADWLASRENPLTARVMVNRVWLHLFGRGLVPTPDNFGVAGQPPSDPALLDHLALQFMNDGWSVKRLIRSLVLSHTYQLATTFDAHNFEVDPDNTLVWRMTPKRLEAEAIRDAVLSIAGEFVEEPPVGSVVARNGEGLVGQGPVRTQYQDPADQHRSVYLPVVRDLIPESLALFDFSDPSLVAGERSTTTVPAQSLYLLNNAFLIRMAESAAEDVVAARGDDPGRVEEAYLRFLCRKPTDAEVARARAFLTAFASADTTAKKTSADGSTRAWTAFCQALMASAEFRYLD